MASISSGPLYWQEHPQSDAGWTTVYAGTATFTVVSGLRANVVYRLRTVGLNADGQASLPSTEAQFITIDNSEVGGRGEATIVI